MTLGGVLDPAAVGAWALGFVVVAYVGLKGGGFDVVIRGQVAVALWWIVALGVGLGVLSARPSRAQTIAGAGLAGLAAWSFLSSSWSASSERAVSEAARDLTILAAFALAAVSITRARVGLMLGGVLSGIFTVAGVAFLSRVHPTWFDADDLGRYLPAVGSRLSYPLNYWNALGALVAMGVPLALGLSVGARRAPLRAAALATIPLFALVGYLVVSRGVVVYTGAALLLSFLVTDRRLTWLVSAALAAVGGALTVLAAGQRDDVRSGVQSALGKQQGDELLAVALVVTVGVGLVAVGAMWLTRGRAPSRRLALAPRVGLPVAGAAVAAVVVAAVLLGAPGEVSHRWTEFKDPGIGTVVNSPGVDRLASASGGGRYQYWQVMGDAFSDHPLNGIGAGSFQTYWAQHATIHGAVGNAHSLFFETLGELGLVGTALLLLLFGTAFVAGVMKVARGGDERAVLAGALGAAAAFTVSAFFDWTWQVTVLPMVFAMVVAALLTRPATVAADDSDVADLRARRVRRFAVPAVALVAIVFVLPSMTAGAKLRDSQAAAAQQRLPAALDDALGAGRVQPYAQSPLLQEALVLEQQGDLDRAAAVATRATRREPDNWRGYFVLARVETLRGNVAAALDAYREAKRHNKASSFLR